MQTRNFSRILGNIPKKPEHLRVSVDEIEQKAHCEAILLTFSAYCERSIVNFTVKAFIPTNAPKNILIRIADKLNRDCSLENEEYALFVISAEDFYKEGKLTERANMLLYRKKQRGYIPLLSWAAIRVFEYAKSLGYENECIFIEAKGELGKSAMLACVLEPGLSFIERKDNKSQTVKTHLECKKELDNPL